MSWNIWREEIYKQLGFIFCIILWWIFLISLMDAGSWINSQRSALGEKTRGRHPGCEKDVYEIEVGLHLRPGLF